MELRFERLVAASRDVVWAELTEPERMNRWSSARIDSIDLGDRGHPGGAGALRRVTVPGFRGRVVLREVIRDAVPPARLVYQVIAGAPIRHHEGTIDLRDVPGGCQLSWTVRVDCNPAVAAVLRATLGPELSRSLDRLAAGIASVAPAALPAIVDVARAPAPELWRDADDILAKLCALAAALEAAGDPKRWFAHAYAYVTEYLLASCRDGSTLHTEWLLRLIPLFHHYFVDNLRRWQGDRPGRAEAHWRRAFTVMERGSRRFPGPRGQLFAGLFLAIRAHIESDLPRALAAVYVDHYADRCDYVRFRGDYLALDGIFPAASDRLIERIPGEHIPSWARLLRRTLPEDAAERLRHRHFYDIPRRRNTAFARGEEIAALLRARA